MKSYIYRDAVENILLRILCSCTRSNRRRPAAANLHRLKVLRGPLKGQYYSMPVLEQVGCAFGSFSSDLVQTLMQHLKAGDVVYDVGANAGYMAMVMSQLVQIEGRVIAFEPDPRNFAALQHNLSDNTIVNVQPHQLALSDHTATAQFATFDCSFVGHIAHNKDPDDAMLIEVQLDTLDRLVYEQNLPFPTLIKIDVEGDEDKVLFGAKRLIKEQKPIIIAEVRNGTAHANIVLLLNKYNYHAVYFGDQWHASQQELGEILFLPDNPSLSA